MPKVSVLIPAYNSECFVRETIQSVLDQTFQDFELIVVDDGSMDNTKKVVEGFRDPRIKYLYQENRGVSAARNNFPVWLFDSESGIPEWPTFGFKLVEPEEGAPHEINGPISLLTALFSTMMEAHDARYIQDQHFARTIPIPTLGIKTTEFDITEARTEALYQSGRKAAEDFLSSWDFAEYIEKYRTNKSPVHRRQLINL